MRESTRGGAVALLVLIATLAGGPAVVAAQDGNTTATPTPTPAESPTPTPTANDSTSGDSGPPTTAEQARIAPIKFQAGYLNSEVRETDQAFNTTGEFVVLSVSERVTAARISQQPAEAQILEGGQQVKVDYQPNAAPAGETSLYQLELYFEDGSSRTVQLYASETEQSVAAARLQEWEPTIDTLCEFATEHGYECNPDSAEEFLVWVNDRADLVDGFLTRQVSRFVGWVILGTRNPLTILVVIGVVALAAAYRQRKHGDILQALQQMADRYTTKVQKLELDYERAKRTADDDDLADVPAIGTTWEQYWTDAFGVKSPLQLARLAAAGEEVYTEDGLQKRHDGVGDLEAGELRDSWLEPVIRHIGDEKVTLNHLLRTFEWVEAEHNLGHHFRDARNRTEDLLDETQRIEEYAGGTYGGRGDLGGAPAPGDD
jgi:hypothetical protein